MIPAPDPRPPGAPVTGQCWFMLQRLPPLLDAFAKETDGVRRAEDIEYIHRMRVASRRLRAALPLFENCFSQKQYGRWMAEIAGITRALGEARDTDVQIAFLVKFEKKQAAAFKKRHKGDGAEPPLGPALQYLLSDLRRKRTRQQDHVLSALDALEKSRVILEMQDQFQAMSASTRRIPRQGLARGVPARAALRIESRLRTLLSYAPWVNHPEAVAEHHATRIAAKKLRYTMEVYGPVYRLGLARPLARVKKIQEILGDLHDCDVWIDQITRILLKERSLLRAPDDMKRPDTATLASLRLFLQDREKERTLLYQRFVRYWESQARAGMWDELRQTILFRRRHDYIPVPASSTGEIVSAARTLARTVSRMLPHEQHVTDLALQLFDGTKPLHNLGAGDRTLLEAAALIHDIGWKGGRRKHHHRGADRVLADETLPLDIAERAVIALMIFSHRGRHTPEEHPVFALLSPTDQDRALRLASLLKVADGFDYDHTGTIHTIRCMTSRDAVTIAVVTPGEVPVECEHARTKADLFRRVFERDLVIR
ncbi:MAG: CHAD domain-containing protein [Methanomicrobiales archaeon]|nr:CHAD domain-containing protein [Methanomicrobiales archaeon]